jgi:deoxyribonuclease (pyrimidine dimer)
MTRVNLIKPSKLYDQHLMAEYREIPMVIASLKRSMKAVTNDTSRLRIPSKFTLNAGHVSFFYDKGAWLHGRYHLCISELRARGFDVDPDGRVVDWDYYKTLGLWHTTWQPNKAEKKISRDRIKWKLKQKPDWYRKTGRA